MGVLDGLTVLDLSWGVSGPATAMLLADNGADVTRIERPGADPFAGWLDGKVYNRGKRSAVLDLTDADDVARFRKLAADRRRRHRVVRARCHEEARHRLRHARREQPASRVLLDHGIRAGVARSPTVPASTSSSPRASGTSGRHARGRAAPPITSRASTSSATAPSSPKRTSTG